MARVTVEDCVQRVPNRFELVLFAAQRARNLSRGEELTVDRDDDKNPVVALREIAEETIGLPKLEQDLIKSLSRAPEPEPADEEVLDLIPTDQNIFGLQDVSAEEEAASMPVEEMSPEDLEAAIEAELGGAAADAGAWTRVHAAVAGCSCPRAGRARHEPAARPDHPPVRADRAGPRLRPQGRHRPDRRRLRHGDAGPWRPARDNGDPYITHPLAVADILAGYRLDTGSIVTALLHDAVEDTGVKLGDIEQRFGQPIAGLVDGVTKLTKLELKAGRDKQAENFRKLVLAMSQDIRVLLVKLADRLHNMRTLHFVDSAERRQRIARETMEIYAPLAERIGMDAIKTELQNLAFAQLEKEAFDTIQARLNFLRGQGADIIEEVRAELARVCRTPGWTSVEVPAGRRARTRSGRRCSGATSRSSSCLTSWRSAWSCRRGRIATWRWARCMRAIR